MKNMISPSSGKKLIIDTDIGPDCDDAGALAVAFLLAKEYGVDIAGVCNCTSNPYGSGAIDAIASYYGYDSLKIGEYRGDHPHLTDCDSYNKYLALNMSERYSSGRLGALSHLDFYRDILYSAGDGEIVLLLIGQFNALADVIKKYPLLVRKKVCRMITMAGQFPSGREYNIFMDAPAARYVFSNFDAPVVFSGFEIGEKLISGFVADRDTEENDSPVRKAYLLYSENGRRFSWDLTAAEYAVAGCNNRYSLSAPGRIVIEGDGSNSFEESPDGNCRYLIDNSDGDEHTAYFDRLLSMKPRGGPGVG